MRNLFRKIWEFVARNCKKTQEGRRNLLKKIWEFVSKKCNKRQESPLQKLEIEFEDIPLPIKMKNLDPIFGYCTKTQFEEIVERMTLLRKKIYLQTNQKNEKNDNIEIFFPIKEIEEICGNYQKLKMSYFQ